MLKGPTIKKIEDFVFVRPRSIQEISEHIKKNWRTTDRYVERICEELGTLSTHVFREGTRGSLKIVYPSATEKISHSVFQEVLEKEIFQGRTKFDFSSFDIYQHVSPSQKCIKTYQNEDNLVTDRLEEYIAMLLKAKKQVLFFSGNLSFVNYQHKQTTLLGVLETLVKKGVNIKIICRIDYSALENIQKVLSLNHKYGKQLIEIRHRRQPLRATLIDSSLFDLKEIHLPTGKMSEPSKGALSFYTITNKEWISWANKIFLKMYHTSIDSQKRLQELEKIRILS